MCNHAASYLAMTTFEHLHCNNSVLIATVKSICLSLHHYSKRPLTKHLSKLQAAKSKKQQLQHLDYIFQIL